MYPDTRFATVGGQSLDALINDQAWNRDTFIPTVGKRGAAIIDARGLSSAASAANAAIDHIRDWVLGSNGKWVTMGIPSRSEEHTSELQSLMRISYAVFGLKKKNTNNNDKNFTHR